MWDDEQIECEYKSKIIAVETNVPGFGWGHKVYLRGPFLIVSQQSCLTDDHPQYY